MNDIRVECWSHDPFHFFIIYDSRFDFYYCGHDSSHSTWTSDPSRATLYQESDLAHTEIRRANLA